MSLLQHLYEQQIQYLEPTQTFQTYSFGGVWKRLLHVFALGESITLFLHPVIVEALHHYLVDKKAGEFL